MDNKFDANESLYRAVFPPEINRMYWKDEDHISSAVFLDKKGLSVERGNYRSDEEVVKEMQKTFIGRIIAITVKHCMNVKAYVVYKPTRRSHFHSEIHGSKNTIILSPAQRHFLASNSRLIKADA